MSVVDVPLLYYVFCSYFTFLPCSYYFMIIIITSHIQTNSFLFIYYSDGANKILNELSTLLIHSLDIRVGLKCCLISNHIRTDLDFYYYIVFTRIGTQKTLLKTFPNQKFVQSLIVSQLNAFLYAPTRCIIY